jgi:hypothetical protein
MRQPCHLYSSLSITIHHREGISRGGMLTNSRRLAMVGFLRWLVRCGSRPGGRSLATTRRSMAPARQVSGARDPPSAASAQAACPADARSWCSGGYCRVLPRVGALVWPGTWPGRASRGVDRRWRSDPHHGPPASTDQVRLARTACGPRSVPDSCGCGAAGPGWPECRCSSARGRTATGRAGTGPRRRVCGPALKVSMIPALRMPMTRNHNAPPVGVREGW